ncbi:MAG TPA: hypothetical protein VG496_18680 [Myxococcales bacterium]|nr:hypothetical protein [Myxococcales bacterium]
MSSRTMQVRATGQRSVGRIAAIVGSWKLGWRIKRARHADRVAARILGGALAGSSAVGRLVDEVRSRGHAQDHLDTAMRASLEEDRADFAMASAWGRPFVVIRGMAARAVLRDRIRLARSARDESRERLGRAALDGSVNLPREPFVVDAGNRARDARARLSSLVGERAALLAPFGGSLLPDWTNAVARELSAFGSAFARVVGNQLIPRLPALAGLVAGWWVTSTFTDSSLVATLHSWGIGDGPRRAVSTETLESMRFWAPIVAAAICSYLGNRIAAKVRARYAPQPTPVVQPGIPELD